ncbi:arginine--tRNA ligase, chloroplastic/mitochondrial [Tanacetum coccineum]
MREEAEWLRQFVEVPYKGGLNDIPSILAYFPSYLDEQTLELDEQHECSTTTPKKVLSEPRGREFDPYERIVGNVTVGGIYSGDESPVVTTSPPYTTRRREIKGQTESEEGKALLEDISNIYVEALLQEEKEISMASEAEDKRWSLVDEISKLFKASLDRCFPELEQEAEVFRSTKKEHGDFTCDYVLMIWPKLRNNFELRDAHPHIKRPRDVGKAIKKNLPDSAIDMIEGRPCVFDVGFVTFSLSPKWMAESIHKMLKNGIDTWAPKLPVERVIVKYPSLDEEILTGLFRRSLIAETLVRMLSHSKVDATMTPTIEKDVLDSRLGILKKWFSIEEIMGTHLVIGVEEKPPFILAKKDLNHLYTDLEALRYGFTEENADWIVCVAPVRQQEYIETCITAAKLENWTPTDRKWQWVPDGTSYVGYRTCNIEPKELASLLDEVEACSNVVAQGEDAKLLGYNAKAVSDCVLQYAFLKDPRLANCTFTSGEMVGEEGNTFVCLLITRAKIHRITHGYRKDIDELMKALEVIVEINEQSERALELHLLEFTEVKPVAESTLLLYVATRVVMDRCFILLGLMPNDRQVPFGLHQLRIRLREQDFRKTGKFNKKTKSGKKKIMKKGIPKLERELLGRCIAPSFVSVAREPFRNSRFEVFSIRSFITKVPKFESGKMFGSISISDKYGSIPDGGSHIFEPDFAYVPLFDHEWFHSIDMHNREYICLGNPSSPNSVAFSSSVEINMEIYVTDKEKKACFEVGCTKMELDLLDIWSRNLGSKCGLVTAKGEDGYTEMYYMLIKDAVDARVEIRYRGGRGPGKVRAEIYAYYGSDILDRCLDTKRPCYRALLFRADEIALEELGEKIPLRKAVMAVPKGAPLKILAHLYDIESDEVILDGICELSSLTEGRNKGAIEGSGCSLSLRVEWKYC